MRRYLTFATVSLALVMSSINTTVVSVALPSLTHDLGISLVWAGWSLTSYQLMMTVAMPLAGKLSDVLGRKRVFLFCVFLFTVSSFLSGVAPNIYWLIAFRALQGLGGGSFMPSAAGIVTEDFPKSRDRAIGLFTSILPIGGVIGPNLGGWLAQYYSWRYVFYINVPVGIAVMLLGSLLLRETAVKSQANIDLPGIGMFTAAIASLMFALTQMGERSNPLSGLVAALFLLLAMALALAFFRREQRVANPVMDLELLKRKPFVAANIYNLFFGASVFGVFQLMPLYAVSVFGLSTLGSGAILTPRSLAVMFTSTVTSFLLNRLGYRLPMVLGLLLIGGSSLALAIPGGAPGGTGFLVLIMVIWGLGMGIAMPASNNACIELMPDRVATIVGLRGLFRNLGGVIGTATGALLLHVYGFNRGFPIMFATFGVALFLLIPVVFLMPERRRTP